GDSQSGERDDDRMGHARIAAGSVTPRTIFATLAAKRPGFRDVRPVVGLSPRSRDQTGSTSNRSTKDTGTPPAFSRRSLVQANHRASVASQSRLPRLGTGAGRGSEAGRVWFDRVRVCGLPERAEGSRRFGRP